jgi:hydrogenase nickel incorporation protein HypB
MTRIRLKEKVLSRNEEIAAELRERFARGAVTALNFIGAPGCGKTALLEALLKRYPPERRVAVLTGDIQTDADARRLSRYGFPCRQITTAGACHLDAAMVKQALDGWQVGALEFLFIENVGNLVCPTSYDLGESAKVVVLSVTEGEEKPLKYPGIFRKAQLMVLSKIDLLAHVPFDLEQAIGNARRINPELKVISLSALTGQGIDCLMAWIDAAHYRSLVAPAVFDRAAPGR